MVASDSNCFRCDHVLGRGVKYNTLTAEVQMLSGILTNSTTGFVDGGGDDTDKI